MSILNPSQIQSGSSVVLPTRKKSEVLWTGLTGRTFAADTDINLINYLKNLPSQTRELYYLSLTQHLIN